MPRTNLLLTLQFSRASLVPGMSNTVARPARRPSKQHKLQGKELFVCIPGQGGVGRLLQTTLITSPDFSNGPCQASESLSHKPLYSVHKTLYSFAVAESLSSSPRSPPTTLVQLTVLSSPEKGRGSVTDSLLRSTSLPNCPGTRALYMQVSQVTFLFNNPLSIQYLE